jgi:hypothetical protein
MQGPFLYQHRVNVFGMGVGDLAGCGSIGNEYQAVNQCNDNGLTTIAVY